MEIDENVLTGEQHQLQQPQQQQSNSQQEMQQQIQQNVNRQFHRQLLEETLCIYVKTDKVKEVSLKLKL